MAQTKPKLKLNIERPAQRERLHVFIRQDTKDWLEKTALQYQASIGKVIDELVEAAR
jgi:hypothetical protein